MTDPTSPHLPDSEVARRRRSAAVAGHKGDATTARRLLADPDASVRATALAAVLRAHDLTSDDLSAALADPSATVRSRAVELVAELRGAGPSAPIALVPTLADHDPTVVEVAAWALGEREVPEPGSVAALADLATRADDALVRESAVAALGAIGDPAGLSAILAATTDKATVRRRAVIALAPFDGEAVEAALHAARTDRDWQVRQAAEDLTTPAPTDTTT